MKLYIVLLVFFTLYHCSVDAATEYANQVYAYIEVTVDGDESTSRYDENGGSDKDCSDSSVFPTLNPFDMALQSGSSIPPFERFYCSNASETILNTAYCPTPALGTKNSYAGNCVANPGFESDINAALLGGTGFEKIVYHFLPKKNIDFGRSCELVPLTGKYLTHLSILLDFTAAIHVYCGAHMFVHVRDSGILGDDHTQRKACTYTHYPKPNFCSLVGTYSDTPAETFSVEFTMQHSLASRTAVLPFALFILIAIIM